MGKWLAAKAERGGRNYKKSKKKNKQKKSATKAEVGRQVPSVTLPHYLCTYSRLPCRCRCPPPVNWNLCCRSTACFGVCYTGDCGWARAVWGVPGALCE